MSFSETVWLGAIAGFTIFLGLPLGRVRGISERVRAFLTMASAGILVFLLFDILKNIFEPIEAALKEMTSGNASSIEFMLLVSVFVLGIAAGTLGLVWFESRFMRRAQPTTAHSTARLAMMIATGLGLHNFSEGLAIGQSAVQGQIALASLLIVGFGLHNATEGFGIVGPLAGSRPSWGFLGLAGLVGGGPTFLGTIVGYSFESPLLAVLFLAIAAGAILYIIGELFHVARNDGLKHIGMLGMLFGFLVASGTELILQFAGA